jgi:hypothetical protein
MGNAASLAIVASVIPSRSDLIRRVERWTYGRKIKLCTGLSAKVIIASEVILVHGLTQDEIDRWMEAYKKGDLEALKIGYGKKRGPLRLAAERMGGGRLRARTAR